MRYTFVNGKTVVVPHMVEDAKISRKHMFKAMLPISKRQFNEGKGEAVWVTASIKTIECLSELPVGCVFFVKVLEDSCYYPSITYGTIIPVQLVTESKIPTGILNELLAKQDTPYIPNEIRMTDSYHNSRHITYVI
jgi:hypothetical protein